jgi:hypothetical protein
LTPLFEYGLSQPNGKRGIEAARRPFPAGFLIQINISSRAALIPRSGLAFSDGQTK